MSDNDSRSGGNAGVVILIAALVLAVPCCGGLALVGAALFGVRTSVRSAPPPMLAPVRPLPAPQVMPMPAPEPLTEETPLTGETESASEPASAADVEKLEGEKLEGEKLEGEKSEPAPELKLDPASDGKE
jgi:hypothetical protein